MTNIKIDASEFLDRVEDQLTWMAVAGEAAEEVNARYKARTGDARNVFLPSHFRCLVPWVDVGLGESGSLEWGADGLSVAGSCDVRSLLDVPAAELRRLLRDALCRLARPLRYAEIFERSGGYGLRSSAVMAGRNRVSKGPAAGMRRVWLQEIDPTAANDGALTASDAALRPDNGGLVDTRTGRPIHDEGLMKGLIVDCYTQISDESFWNVELSLSAQRSGIGLRTDAAGARDLLSALGRQANRQALVHWVRAHARRARGAGDPSMVRAHLRGTQFALAKHLFATVWPSTEDIDRACNGARFEQGSP